VFFSPGSYNRSGTFEESIVGGFVALTLNFEKWDAEMALLSTGNSKVSLVSLTVTVKVLLVLIYLAILCYF
jgi:hypothetical protein